ncbi:MAG: protein kinase domain-containing protein, partial [Candidatus Eiseniibacteriota bacterium]
MVTDAPTQNVSHYRLLERIGRGSMGEVWFAEDHDLPRQVAIKLLAPELCGDAQAVDRLLREAEAASHIDHPSVVSIYEVGLFEARPFLVMRWVEGETLAERFRRGPLTASEVRVLVRQLADALAEVHAMGIVHRDLKASNIVLSPQGPMILDFGIASLGDLPRLTRTGLVLGTPVAMSPEQWEDAPLDHRIDLWALGVLMYEALTGEPPFAGSSLEALGFQILNRDPPAPSICRPEIGAGLDAIVLKLLRKNPAHRYAQAEQVIADLDHEERGVGAGPAEAPRAVRQVPRVAVLYFDAPSPGEADTVLAAALTEDLIVDLARLRQLRVATRAEVLVYRGQDLPSRRIARELGVDYLVLGAVRRLGGRVRVSVELVRGADQFAVWADRFDHNTGELFETQAEIAQRIARALRLELGSGEVEMLARAPARDPEIYGLFIKARGLMDQGDEDGNRAAQQLLEQAVEGDPGFALAHAALGESYARGAYFSAVSPTVVTRALECAKRSLAIEPDLVEGHLVRAFVYRLRGDQQELLGALDGVTAIDPDHPVALEWAAACYLVLDRPADAVRILERLTARDRGRYFSPYYLGVGLD